MLLKETTGRSKSRLEDNIKIDRKEIVPDDDEKIQWTLARDEWQTSANSRWTPHEDY
jgi:hypothetical protein